MNEQKAKDLSIEVWEEIVERELLDKEDLSAQVFNKVKNMPGKCPLCALFNEQITSIEWQNNCSGCPLKEAGQQCLKSGDEDYYSIWLNSVDTKEQRIEGARNVLRIIKEWKIK